MNREESVQRHNYIRDQREAEPSTEGQSNRNSTVKVNDAIRNMFDG